MILFHIILFSFEVHRETYPSPCNFCSYFILDGPTVEPGVGEEMEVVETKTEVKDEAVKPKHELPFRLTVDDLLLLADFFYLPHQHGKRALQILNEFRWLKANSIKSDELSDTESAKKVRSISL